MSKSGEYYRLDPPAELVERLARDDKFIAAVGALLDAVDVLDSERDNERNINHVMLRAVECRVLMPK